MRTPGGAATGGQRGQATSVSSTAAAASASQVADTPSGSSAGTSTAPDATPTPTPVNIVPAAKARRSGATACCTAGPASTISTPPDIPASRRQGRYHDSPAA